MIPPTKPRKMGKSHQAHEVRCSSLGIGRPHSGQNRASLDIPAPQTPQECKDLPQYWQ